MSWKTFMVLQASRTGAADGRESIAERLAFLDMVLRGDPYRIAEMVWNGGLKRKIS
jgi:hypothetical protein